MSSHGHGGRPFVSGDPRAKQWKSGETGNAGGRPKGLTTLIREETRMGAEIVEFVLTVFRNGSVKQRQWAADWLADRGFGRPIQMIGLMSTEELGEAMRHAIDVINTVVHSEIRDPAVAGRLLQAMRQGLLLEAERHEQAALETTAGGLASVRPLA